MATVQFPTQLSKDFYSRAKIAFPNEEYAICLGRSLIGGNFRIEKLYFPTARLNDQSPDRVDVQPGWFETAAEMAVTDGMEVIGDIHSHCYEAIDEGGADTTPSKDDWKWAEAMSTVTFGKYRIMGIVRVQKSREKVICSNQFWPAIELFKTIK